MLEWYEAKLKRNEKQWIEDKISYEMYQRRHDRFFESVSVLKIVLGEE